MKKNEMYEKILKRKNKEERKKDPLIKLNKSKTKRLEKAFFATIKQEEEDYLDQQIKNEINNEFNF